jgi:type I restriction enzyme, S subunit
MSHSPKLIPLADAGAWVGGGTPSQANKAFWSDHGIPWVTPTDMVVAEIGATAETITALAGANSTTRMVPAGSTLLVFRSGILRRKLPVALNIVECAINQDLKAIIPSPTLNHRYLFQGVAGQSERIRQRSLKAGTTVESLDLRTVQRCGVLMLPLPEQRGVADILEAVDAAIRETEALIAKLRVVRAEKIDAVIGRSSAELKQRFGCKKLAALSLKITDGTHQSVETVRHSENSVPFLYVSCVKDGAVDWASAARISLHDYRLISKGREPSVGMVLYTAVGSFGHAAVVDVAGEFSFQRHIACIFRDEGVLLPHFLATWLNSPEGRFQADRAAVGNAQKTVTLGAIGRFLYRCLRSKCRPRSLAVFKL